MRERIYFEYESALDLMQHMKEDNFAKDWAHPRGISQQTH